MKRTVCNVHLIAVLIVGVSFKVLPLDNGVALTPPMGWSTWNTFPNKAPISLDSIKATVDSMESKGLLRAGYVYINADAGANISSIIPNLHSRGFKAGTYSGAGGTPSQEISKASRWATNGYDFIKYDYFSTPVTDSTWARMRDALAATGRPIVFSAHCASEITNATVSGFANMWRTGPDIYIPWENPPWNKVLYNISRNNNYAQYAKPGYWNDPDMLLIGPWNDDSDTSFFNPDQERTHFSLWCIAAAPLIIGADMRHIRKVSLDVLLNAEVIAIDQDSLGYQGRPVKTMGATMIWSKNLKNGDKAVLLYNGSTVPARVCARWSDIGFSGTLAVRDLWAHTDLGMVSDSFVATDIPVSGCVMLRVSPQPLGIQWRPSLRESQKNGCFRVVNPFSVFTNQTTKLFDVQGRNVSEQSPEDNYVRTLGRVPLIRFIKIGQ